MSVAQIANRPRVVIVGAGFGGINAAFELRKADVDLVVIDRQNHHLFQPLLYQVATAGLSANNIAAPIRHVLRGRACRVVMGEVVGVDRARRCVITRESGEFAYDWLVLATGSRHSYFKNPEWEAFAPGLKTIGDALAIRRRILSSFERAEVEADTAKRRAELTFVLVGGGPTGVEMAGAIAELARTALNDDYRNIDTRQARILLLEAAPRVLGTFATDSSEYARRTLKKLGVEVRLETLVTGIDANGVDVRSKTGGAERILSRNVIWTAGVKASPVGEWLGLPVDRLGRVAVTPNLTVPDDEHVFVIGDVAAALGPKKEPKTLPGVAPVAIQEGQYVGRVLRRRVREISVGRPVSAAKPFRFRDKGFLATIGRSAAVAEIGDFHSKGFFAWLLWCFVHVLYLIDFKNRVLVMIEWVWAYLTYGRGARLISSPQEFLSESVSESTGPESAMSPPAPSHPAEPPLGPGTGISKRR